MKIDYHKLGFSIGLVLGCLILALTATYLCRLAVQSTLGLITLAVVFIVGLVVFVYKTWWF